jgi:hypothetical protein
VNAGKHRRGSGDADALTDARCAQGLLRFRLGKLESVRPRWRGDPAYGVSRRVYRLLSPARHSAAIIDRRALTFGEADLVS